MCIRDRSVTRDFPTNLLYKSFRNKRIKVNGKKGAPEDRIKAGDLIELYINDEFFPPEGAKPAHKPAPKKQQNQPKMCIRDSPCAGRGGPPPPPRCA